MQRRTFLKVLGCVGAVSFTGLSIGCSDKNEEGTDVNAPSEFPDISTYPGSKPEAKIDLTTGKVEVDPAFAVRHSACLGCYNSCGNRLKIDKSTGKIMRLYGNPYNPNNSQPHLAFEKPLKDSYLAFSRYEDRGNTQHATLCVRGNASIDAHYDPMRILTPLKRTSGRGEGKWKPISWDELVEETVVGGKLFSDIGEDYQVDGFQAVRDLETDLDPEAPEFGSKANQLIFIGGRNDGRTSFSRRFTSSFGTVNAYGHGYS